MSSSKTKFLVGPYLKVFSPEAFVAIVPPIKQLSSVGSGGYRRFFSLNSFWKSAKITPGSKTA